MVIRIKRRVQIICNGSVFASIGKWINDYRLWGGASKDSICRSISSLIGLIENVLLFGIAQILLIVILQSFSLIILDCIYVCKAFPLFEIDCSC